jgi:hypothetical protein
MRNLIYFIIPVLVVVSTFIGRIYWARTLAFGWVFNSDQILLKVVLATILYAFILSIALAYIIYYKHKRGKEYSFIEQILLVSSTAFFVELTINGFLIKVCFGGSMVLAAAYYITYIFTLPLAMLISYVFVLTNDESP